MSKVKFKRLFFDIETSPNLVFSWNVGRKLNLDYDNIIAERAIICICYKWEDEKTVHSLEWNRGNDKEILKKFVKVLEQADEIIGHNSDSFDIKWLRTRCIFHNIPMIPDYQSVDTLKLSRRGFRFNSNRLDYIGKYLGVGQKATTGGFGLWKDIVLNNGKKSMLTMVNYCKQDVKLLEDVYKKLNPYVLSKTHAGVATGKDKCSCPHCGGSRLTKNGSRISASGIKRIRLHCQECGKYSQISELQYEQAKVK